MNNTAEKIDSLAKLKEKCVACGVDANDYVYSFIISVPPDTPPEVIESFRDTECNAHNFWVFRDYMRSVGVLGSNRHDNRWSERLENLLRLKNVLAKARETLGWQRVAATETADMVAYTASYQHGVADRRTRIGLGRYLTKFYSKWLNAEEIRSLVNLSKPLELKMATGRDNIARVYTEGPHSCMAGVAYDGVHAVETYGYRYDDGSYEFAVAYFEQQDMITARALVSLKHKVFTRHYGDDGTALQDALEAKGYKKVSGMGSYGLRLLAIEAGGGAWLAPYLDGGDNDLTLCTDSDGREYFEWVECGDYTASSTDGMINASAYTYCECCDDRIYTNNENTFEVLESEERYSEVCHSCREENYRRAYTAPRTIEWVNRNRIVRCDSNDEYYAEWALGDCDIVCTRNGGYAERDSVTWLEYMDDFSTVDDDVVQLHDNEYALESDAVKLHSGEWALQDDVVELHSGEYALESDAAELADGTWALKDDCDIDANGDWVLTATIEETKEEKEAA